MADDPIVSHKTCTKCGLSKARSDFSKNSSDPPVALIGCDLEESVLD